MSENLPPNERPQASQSRRDNAALVGGMVLVLIGVYFLLQNLGIVFRLPFDINWWALFILIPAGMILSNVWRSYRANGDRLVGEARNQLIVGVLIAAVALVFLFDIGWDNFWPLLLILGGVLILLANLRR